MSPLRAVPIEPTLAEEVRFWSKVDKSGDCWLWTDALGPDGYAQFRVGRRRPMVHRISYVLTHGEPPAEMPLLDHLCHVRSCVRPAHLRPVTNKQNGENRNGVQVNNTSGARGVFWHSRDAVWEAYVRSDGQYYSAGRFDTIAEAEVAVIAKRLELFTHSDMDLREVAA